MLNLSVQKQPTKLTQKHTVEAVVAINQSIHQQVLKLQSLKLVYFLPLISTGKTLSAVDTFDFLLMFLSFGFRPARVLSLIAKKNLQPTL